MAPTTELHPQGDIILVLEDGTKLRVHSTIMKAASKVFRVMFGPCFSEGQNLSEADPKELPLYDDHPEAMTVICEVIHNRYDVTLPPPHPDLITNVACLVDKYDLSFAMMAVSTIWFRGYKEEENYTGWRDNKSLLAAAYLFDNAYAFFRVSRDLILHHQGSFLKLDDIPGVPWQMFVAIAEKQAQAKEELRIMVTESVFDYLEGRRGLTSSCEGAGCAQAFATSFVLDENGIWPATDLGLAACYDYWSWLYPQSRCTFAQRLESWKQEIPLCTPCMAMNESDFDLITDLDLAAHDALNELEGLCLDYVKNNGEKPKICRMKHD